jgi:hypothetical protein
VGLIEEAGKERKYGGIREKVGVRKRRGLDDQKESGEIEKIEPSPFSRIFSSCNEVTNNVT